MRRQVEFSIQKWGNSSGIRLPAVILHQLGVAPGDTLTAEIVQGRLVLEPARRRFTLAELVAQCDLDAPMPQDLVDWHAAGPAGREAW